MCVQCMNTYIYSGVHTCIQSAEGHRACADANGAGAVLGPLHPGQGPLLPSQHPPRPSLPLPRSFYWTRGSFISSLLWTP